jgi:hypothetical protein
MKSLLVIPQVRSLSTLGWGTLGNEFMNLGENSECQIPGARRKWRVSRSLDLPLRDRPGDPNGLKKQEMGDLSNGELVGEATDR